MPINTSIFDHFPVLETERLILRDIRLSDAPQIFEMRSNGKVNQFIARQNMQEEQAAVLLAEKTRLAFENRQAIGWAGVLKSSPDVIIGTCGFNQIDYPNLHAEIGGELALEYWQNKIASEAVIAILRFGLEVMGLRTIEAKVSPKNLAAIGVLEKFGFVKEAHFKDRIFHNGQFSDMGVWTLHAAGRE